MSQEENQNKEENAPEAPENEKPEETPKEESPVEHQEKPEKEVDDSPQVEYNAQNEQMASTFPVKAPDDYHNMGDSNGFPQSNTQHHFNPRNTFHARSTDRGARGMKHYARLSANWDSRFHISPTINNKKSHTFYKQFFGKPTRTTQVGLIKHKRFADPYLQNDAKTRIPKYSKIYRERDIGKELNWVDNFSVTHSKNNNQVHRTYKEYFDKPVGYHGHITVATTKGVGDVASTHKISKHKPLATLHVLQDERGNRHARHRDLDKSIEFKEMIPFLRDHAERHTMGRRSLKKMRRGRSEAHKNNLKEQGWNRVGFPISAYNEAIHFKNKIKFDDL